MSSEEFAAVHRQCLLDNIRAGRRAIRMAAGEFDLQNELERRLKDDVFTMSEYLHNLEWRTGYPILSTTRAQMRREGRRVN